MNQTSSKKLTRSQKNRIIAGVCGGFADYFNLDPTLVRIVWILLSLVNGIGILVYIAALVLMPEESAGHSAEKKETNKKRSESAGMVVGIILISVGLIFLMRESFQVTWPYHWPIFVFPFMRFDLVLPLILVLLGIWFVVYAGQKDSQQPNAASGKKIFRRSRSERMVGGVCGGLAKYWSVDVTLIRIGFVLITLATQVALGVLAYLVILLAVPEEEEKENKTETTPLSQPKEKTTTRKRKSTGQSASSSASGDDKSE